MRLYVYCLSDELSGAPSERPAGLGGARVRLAEFGRVSAVVSEFEGARAAVTRENLRAHNLVNSHVLARATPLPFRFGTLADESRLAEYVASNEGALLESLARVRGCVEMGVKVRLVEGAEESDAKTEGAGVKPEAGATESEAGATLHAAGAGGRGTAFLLAKRREILGDEGSKARAEEAAARLGACVGEIARESDVSLSPDGPIVVRAAHLVARGDAEEYRARARGFGAGLRGMQTLTSGPWPPYSFSKFSVV